MTQEQKAALINAHRAASQLLADVRLVIHQREQGDDNPDLEKQERFLRKQFNQADREFMDLVLAL